MTGRTKGSLWRRAMFESAATEFVLQFGLPCIARLCVPGGEDFGSFAENEPDFVCSPGNF
jgi:hypothetical protein